MTELKTLKDITFDTMVEFADVNSSDLKLNAIKWLMDCSPSIKIAAENNDLRCNKCNFIIQFFNLTQEDLK